MSAENNGRNLPVGFKFNPTDQELLGYYLRHKVSGEPFKYETQIKSFDLYGKTEPWDIWTEFGGPGLDESEDLYFFTKPKKFSDSASVYARRSGSGTWKQRNKGVTIFDSKKKKMVLGRRTQFYYEHNESDQDRCWVMQEYSLPPSETSKLPHEYVLCRIRINRRRKLVAKIVSRNHVDNEAIDHECELDEMNDISSPLEDNDASNNRTDHVNNSSESVLTSQPLPSYHPKEDITDHDSVQDYPLYDDYVFSRLMLFNVGDTHGLQQQSFTAQTETPKGGSFAASSYTPYPQ